MSIAGCIIPSAIRALRKFSISKKIQTPHSTNFPHTTQLPAKTSNICRIKKGGLFPHGHPHIAAFPARPPYAPAASRLALSPVWGIGNLLFEI